MSNHYNDPLTDVEADTELHPFRKRHAQQLRALFNSMPYGGICHFTRVDTLDEAIANLTSLRDTLIDVAESNQNIEDQYRGLVADVAAVGRLFGTGDSRIAAAKLLGFDLADVTPPAVDVDSGTVDEKTSYADIIITLEDNRQVLVSMLDGEVTNVATRDHTAATWGVPFGNIDKNIGPGEPSTFIVRAG